MESSSILIHHFLKISGSRFVHHFLQDKCKQWVLHWSFVKDWECKNLSTLWSSWKALKFMKMTFGSLATICGSFWRESLQTQKVGQCECKQWNWVCHLLWRNWKLWVRTWTLSSRKTFKSSSYQKNKGISKQMN
jgi:hypothetical protein